MIVNKNSEGRTIIIKKLPNGQRIKARFEKTFLRNGQKKNLKPIIIELRVSMLRGWRFLSPF